MIRLTSSLLVILSSFADASLQLVTVRQQSSKQVAIETVATTNGAAIRGSSLTFAFSWPYVQLTCDAAVGVSYLTAYPDGNSYPVLYQLDGDLQVTNSWLNESFTWWDLQYSTKQSTLYGIKVTQDFNGGMYGRTLSNYTLSEKDNAIYSREMYTLPYMWYVNASSFDIPTCTYFALVNNFPGKSNSTLEQQLLVADLHTELTGTSAPPVTMLTIDSGDVMLQFVSYSTAKKELFFAGFSKTTSSVATVGVLCSEHGKIEKVLWTSDKAIRIGPLAVDDLHNQLLFFVQLSESPLQWELLSLSLEEGIEEVVTLQVYNGEDYKIFAAADVMVSPLK